MRTTTALFVGGVMSFGVTAAVLGITEPSRSGFGATSVPSQLTKSSRLIVVSADLRGMLVVDGRINDVAARFMIDTGATYTSLNHRVEQVLRTKLVYGPVIAMSTANGIRLTPTTRFASIQIGHIILSDVEGIIASSNGPDESLLGMSFLSRLKRWEYQNGKLVLEE